MFAIVPQLKLVKCVINTVLFLVMEIWKSHRLLIEIPFHVPEKWPRNRNLKYAHCFFLLSHN